MCVCKGRSAVYVAGWRIEAWVIKGDRLVAIH